MEALPLSAQSPSSGDVAALPSVATDRLPSLSPPGSPHPSAVVKQEPDPAMDTDTVYPSTETAAPAPVWKQVTFKLLLSHPHKRARLPMTVNIFPHDATDSIISTVRNFFGLYERKGLAFEDDQGTTLIARFENFTAGMTINIRITSEEPDMRDCSPSRPPVPSPRRARLEDNALMLPPNRGSHSLQSPQASASHKSRARPPHKNRVPASHGSFADGLDANEGSDSDGGSTSVTSSRRSKKALVASAEISQENIVEGGRRKRQKFDSSELPLYIPTQVPDTASLSSISPQKRLGSHNGASPSLGNHYPTWPHSLESPQPHGDAAYHHGLATPYTTPGGVSFHHGARYNQYTSRRQSGNAGMLLPTPDATNSVISDEDVARQLMRLGEPSNFSAYSTHGRTSTSTLDDALSRDAQMSSDDEESDEGTDREHDLPPLPYGIHDNGSLRRNYDCGASSGDDYNDNGDESFKGESDQMLEAHLGHARVEATKPRLGSLSKTDKATKPKAPRSKSKASSTAKQPISPTSLPPQSRKASSASVHQHLHQHQLAADEEDLSAKPRCQRCRKSKKGCDRMRPCGRCKDAGIGIEGCISEDEAAGRKGRFGRHMGIPVKKQMGPPVVAHTASYSQIYPADTVPQGFAVPFPAEKSKKRKNRS